MRTSLRRAKHDLLLHSFISFASTPRWRSARLAAICTLCVSMSLIASSSADARPHFLSADSISIAASPNDDARQRALDALEHRGAHTDLPNDASILDQAPIQARDRGIPRKMDALKLPEFSCNPRTDTPNTCGGCGGCPSAVPTSNLSTTARLVGALVGIAALIAIAVMLRHIWMKRAYPTHREFQEHELLDEARALSPTAIDDALSSKNYNVAVHALFLRTLLRLNTHGFAILKGWTPREIPPSIALPPPIREQLSALVLLAEHARFADHRSSEDEFELAARTAELIDEYLEKEDA